eukprot:g48040.t1
MVLESAVKRPLSRTDFVTGLTKVPMDLQMQEECLGMAVLDIMRISKEKKWNLQQICDHVSHCEADLKYLKLKYLMDMESLETVPSKETFHVKDPTWDPQEQEVHKFICVSGEHGIQWSLKQDEQWQPFCDFPEIVDITLKQASRDYVLEESRIVTVTKQDNKLLAYQYSVSFNKIIIIIIIVIIVIVIVVIVIVQEDKLNIFFFPGATKEAEFPTLREALSFVALIDGYYRLTADAHHYFCKEVAPPKLLHHIEDNCHGPITLGGLPAVSKDVQSSSDFAMYKLKKLGNKKGLYLLRCSPKEFNKYFLTVCVETKLATKVGNLTIQPFKLIPSFRREPVSLTLYIDKMLESIIKDEIVEYLKVPGKIRLSHYAFIKGRSTEDSSLEHLNNKDTYVRLLLIVYSSTFNTIIPSRLISK